MNEKEIRLDQTKKVFEAIAYIINEGSCSYRGLIYGLLGFDCEAYCELISGLTITNAIVELEELREKNTQLKEEYQTELDENCKLSELWKDSQVENRQLKDALNKAREYIDSTLDGQYALEPDYAPDFTLVNTLEKIDDMLGKGLNGNE